MNLEKKKDEVPKTPDVPVFSKQQFLLATSRAHQKDLLNALLEDELTYSNDQVDSIISEFLGRVVE